MKKNSLDRSLSSANGNSPATLAAVTIVNSLASLETLALYAGKSAGMLSPLAHYKAPTIPPMRKKGRKLTGKHANLVELVRREFPSGKLRREAKLPREAIASPRQHASQQPYQRPIPAAVSSAFHAIAKRPQEAIEDIEALAMARQCKIQSPLLQASPLSLFDLLKLSGLD